MNAEETVLIVGDEERLLDGLRRQLRGKFEIVTAVGGERALEILENQSEIAVIVSDMHMPGMTGIEVLEAFIKKSPATARIILTESADQDCAIEAINKSHVFGFLKKPCSTDILIESIENGLAHHRFLVREKKLMETTLAGSIKLLSDVVSLMDPAATFGSRKIGRWAHVLSPHLKRVKRWELDFAVMLAPLGRISIPLDSLLRHNKSESLSEKEQAMIENVPKVGNRLLNNIPSMATVSKAVLYQDKNFDGSGFPDDKTHGAEIPVIARVLRILKSLAEISGDSELAATHLDELLRHREWFDPELLLLARQYLIAPETATPESKDPKQEEVHTPRQSTMVRTSTLHEGQRLAADLINTDGTLILSEGTKLSQTQVEKIRSMLELNKLSESTAVVPTEENESPVRRKRARRE
tara:strand:+ start:1637 stop:2872 length:1236 start_codon:yes stop_codon:yes gene_type:complete